MIEKSVSVKCPTMAECLIGTKKVQQVFALPGVVERFITDKNTAQRIRNTFAGLYSLDPVLIEIYISQTLNVCSIWGKNL